MDYFINDLRADLITKKKKNTLPCFPASLSKFKPQDLWLPELYLTKTNCSKFTLFFKKYSENC